MICCSPEFIQTLDTDQAIWNFTDYAVDKNPNVRIGLAMPWKDFPGEYDNASEYATNSTLDLMPYWENLSQDSAIILEQKYSHSIMAPLPTKCGRCSNQEILKGH